MEASVWRILLCGLIMAAEVAKEVTSDPKPEGRPIPGEPGRDYPILNDVPDTSFKCPADGYFADPDARCQVFHVCLGRRHWSFLCPNGTVFHQSLLTCTWWTDFDCSSAQGLYKPLWDGQDGGPTQRPPAHVTPSPPRPPPTNTYLPPHAK